MNRWIHTLFLGDVFHDESRTFEQRRDEIVRRIKASRWYDEDDWRAEQIVEDLAETVDADDFDGPWSDFYDWADASRVWVETIRSTPRVNA